MAWRKSTCIGDQDACVEAASLPDSRKAVCNSNRPDAGVVFTGAQLPHPFSPSTSRPSRGGYRRNAEALTWPAQFAQLVPNVR
ncbi:DUF397 domain-containing protein [Streptomyces sp. NPDC056227]|uniref:DUF397 domain-containing protein n=1 Tax=Streptomyces sp. NPDC056227 TaxID=3345753 RepID=UPI0035D90471